MERTERFCRIELLIRSRGCVSFADLMTELGISRATLKRDLDHLRTRMDAAIVYDRERNGYRFAGTGRLLRRGAEPAAPGVWFSEREIHALLTMHQLLDGLGVGSSMGRHLQPVLERLQGMLGTSESEARELVRRLRVVPPVRKPVRGRSFERLAGAVLERRRLRLTIALDDGGGERERIVMALGISDHVGLGRAVVAEAGVGERVQCLLGDVDAHMRAFRCLRSAFHFGWNCRNALSVLIGSQKSPSGRSSCHH